MITDTMRIAARMLAETNRKNAYIYQYPSGKIVVTVVPPETEWIIQQEMTLLETITYERKT